MPKNFWESKLFWLGVLITLQGALPLVQTLLESGPITASSVITLVSGVLVVVLRVWFTDQPIRGARA